MAGLTPLPPTITHTTTRLTHREAHDFLDTFLSRAEIDAAYRPDSTLAERGPQALSTGSSPNLTLHHLKRILLGIEGKRVGKQVLEQEGEGAFDERELGLRNSKRARGYDGYDDEGEEQDTNGGKRRSKPYTTGLDIEIDAEDGDGPALVAHPNISSSPHLHANHENNDDWQEKETYDLAQSSEGLELTNEDRHPGADLAQPGNEEEEQDFVAIEDERTGELVDPRNQIRTNGGEASGSGRGKTSVDKDERKRLKKLKAHAEKSQREEERKVKAKAKGKAV